MLVTNIQRFSLHDGPGIRTTVFLKGCSLRCPWCCNPENINPFPEKFKTETTEGIYGREITPEELYKEILKDEPFFAGDLHTENWLILKQPDVSKLPGGVTFSGGEPLLQMNEVSAVIRLLHTRGIHVAVETSLYATLDQVQIAVDNFDFMYIDMKVMSSDQTREIIHGSLDHYLRNWRIVIENGNNKRRVPIVVRIPVIHGYTDTSENRKRIKDTLVSFLGDGANIIKVELIKEHNLGSKKYYSLGLNPPEYNGVDENVMTEFQKELSDIKLPVELCRI